MSFNPKVPVLGYDPRFGGLQGVDVVDVQKPVPDDGADPFLDNRFAPLDTGGLAQGNALRATLENPTAEDLAEAAQYSTDPEFKQKVEAELADIQNEKEAVAFKKAHPEYEPTDRNYQALLAYLRDNELLFTAESLDEAYKALLAVGKLDVPEGTAKTLTDANLLTVARLAQSGKVADALGAYLHFALPHLSSEELMLVPTDPAYLELCNEAVYYVFVNSQADYVDSEENRAYLNEYLNGRPASLTLLQAGWKTCVRDSLLRAADPPEQVPTPESIRQSIENLSNEDLEDTLQAALRERARQIRGR